MSDKLKAQWKEFVVPAVPWTVIALLVYRRVWGIPLDWYDGLMAGISSLVIATLIPWLVLLVLCTVLEKPKHKVEQ